MMKEILLDYLARRNSANPYRDRFLKIDRSTLSVERKLLYREAKFELTAHSSHFSTDILWNRIAALHENYRRYVWNRRGLKLDLAAPLTLAEKIEWIKFNEHNSVFPILCNKLAVRNYVLEKTQKPNILNRILVSDDEGGGNSN